MAKIEFTLGEISGRMGGVVFSKNPSGNYIKNFTKQNNPSSQKQAKARAALSQQVVRWQSITEDQRNAWRALTLDTYDTFGNIRALKGRNLFISLNTNLTKIGQSNLEDPPIDLTAPTGLSGETKIRISEQRVDPPFAESYNMYFEETPAGAGDSRILIYASRPLPITVNAIAKDVKMVINLARAVGTENFFIEYYNIYGNWTRINTQNTRAVHIRIQIISTINGRTAPPITGKCIFGKDTIIWASV